MKVAAVLEATMSEEQVDQLVRLMEEGISSRPKEVALATLHVNGSQVRMVAYWNSAEALEAYRAEAPMLRGEELMRKVGVAPDSITIVDVPAFG